MEVVALTYICNLVFELTFLAVPNDKRTTINRHAGG